MRMDWQAAYQKVSEILAERTEERDQLRGEIKRLQGIEKALCVIVIGDEIVPITRKQAAREHRWTARIDRRGGAEVEAQVNDAIADALEVE